MHWLFYFLKFFSVLALLDVEAISLQKVPLSVIKINTTLWSSSVFQGCIVNLRDVCCKDSVLYL